MNEKCVECDSPTYGNGLCQYCKYYDGERDSSIPIAWTHDDFFQIKKDTREKVEFS